MDPDILISRLNLGLSLPRQIDQRYLNTNRYTNPCVVL